MSDGHDHASAVGASGEHRGRLLAALGLTSLVMLVEVVAGFALDSLALVSGAGHMLTDVAGLGMALAAIQVARSRRSPAATYGFYRLEVLAALANTLLLLAVAAYVVYEAVGRFGDPIDVPGSWLLVVAVVGLVANLGSLLLLRGGAGESLNVRGAFLEVLSDLLGSVGVLVAGVVLLVWGWPYADPIVGIAIGVFILPRALRLGRDALRILLQVAPPEIDVEAARRRLLELSTVRDVSDLHVWTLTSGLRIGTLHVRPASGADAADALREATALLRDELGIEHVTVQIDPDGAPPDELPV